MDAAAAGFRRHDFPKAEISSSRNSVTLHNGLISLTWKIQKGSIFPDGLHNGIAEFTMPFGKSEIFEFSSACSPFPKPVIVKSGELKAAESLKTDDVIPAPHGTRYAEGIAGKKISADFICPRTGVKIKWSAVLRDGSNYIRQFFALSCEEAAEITKLVLWNIPSSAGNRTFGANEGSPVGSDTCFFGFEHCMAANKAVSSPDGTKRIECSFDYTTPLWDRNPVKYSSVVGVSSKGNIRRSFLYYMERERAMPYRQNLQHNNAEGVASGYFGLIRKNKISEASRRRKKQFSIWKNLIESLGKELTEKRGVVIDSFCHDHSWDNENLIWQFHDGFPRGFDEADETSSAYGAGLGVWISPMGGYNYKITRMETGHKKHGFEITQRSNSYSNDKAFICDVSGKRYKTRFYISCLNMIKKYNVNYFKFDGFAGGGNIDLGSHGFASQIDALIEIMDNLRRHKPGIFLNPTVGSWQSPFWLLHADATWRPGNDHGVCGKGTLRQRWITYRDANVFKIVKYHSPLYPISSLMTHGIQLRENLESNSKGDKDAIDEIRSFFATGINLQELYISPNLMTAKTWDVLAEAAKWAKSNEDIMADTHWVGGDPEKNEIYGWASYGHGRGILGLRNPDDKRHTIKLDVGKVFELPAEAHPKYLLMSPWKDDKDLPPVKTEAGKKTEFILEPFQVLVFNALKG